MLCKVVREQDSFSLCRVLLFVVSIVFIYSSLTVLLVILLYDMSRGLYEYLFYVFSFSLY